MDSNLLKEAIADAKAVRQTALANAKVALEEAFSERYHAMFAEKLKEDAEMGGAQPADSGMKAEDQEVTGQEIDELIKELEAEVGEEVPQAAPGEEVPGAVPPVAPSPMGAAPAVPGAVPPGCPPVMPGAPAVAPVPAIGAPITPGGVPPMDMGGVPQAAPAATPPPSDVPPVSGEETDEDVNLDELLASLKEEIAAEGYEEEGKKEELDEKKDLKSSGIAPGGNKKPSASASSSSGVESGGIRNHGLPEGETTSDKDINVTMPEKNFGKNKDGNLASHSPLKETIALANKGLPNGETTSDEDINVTMPEKNFGKNKDGNLATTPSIKENQELKRQLSEAEEVIKYVKVQLNEVNLLNAKLLYTNKLFKEYNMNNEQKMRIVEMFDLAKNVREVKLTYANLAETLNFGGIDVKKKPTQVTNTSVQSITEGLASKPVGGTKPSAQIISEGKTSAMVSKFQKLAGIKRS